MLKPKKTHQKKGSTFLKDSAKGLFAGSFLKCAKKIITFLLGSMADLYNLNLYKFELMNLK